MRTLSRYVSSRFLRSFLGSAAILAVVIIVVDMLLNLDDILETQDTMLGAVQTLLLRAAAFYLPYLIPFAVFTGAFLSIGLAARSREILAMKAGGVSPVRAVVPVFLWAAVISVVALLVNETVTVPASSTLNEKMGIKSGELYLRSGTIWYHTGRFIYNTRSFDAERATFHDIRVFERDEAGRLVRLIQADKARREAPGVLRFKNVTLRRFDPTRPEAPLSLERSDEVLLELAEERSPQLLGAELATLPAWTLARYVLSVRSSGNRAPNAETLLSKRLSGTILVILFALLAVPLALRVEQTQSIAFPAVQATFILFVFLMAQEYVPLFATQDSLPAPAAPWLVIALFLAFGGWRLTRVPR